MLCIKGHLGLRHRPQGTQKQIEQGNPPGSVFQGRQDVPLGTGRGRGISCLPIPLRVQTPLKRVWEPQGVDLRAVPLSACTSGSLGHVRSHPGLSQAAGLREAACPSCVTANIKGQCPLRSVQKLTQQGSPRGGESPEPSVPGPGPPVLLRAWP